MKKLAKLCLSEAARIHFSPKEPPRFLSTTDELEVKYSAILLAACQVGPYSDRIAKFLEMPRTFVREVGKKARKKKNMGRWSNQ